MAGWAANEAGGVPGVGGLKFGGGAHSIRF
jgi:hypothetical protein